jgi:outer membrane beta-barrel protein
MKITTERGLKIAIVLGALVWLSLVAASWAESGEAVPDTAGANRAPASETGDSGEYNFNWLDPEKKIYVLQNRRYLKANHPMASLMGGLGFSNPYRTSLNLDARGAYYINESWGIEAFYKYTHNSANSNAQALEGTGSQILPVIREIKGQYGALVHWVPWYAKINVFNQILYFDWYFSGGAGGVSYDMYNSSADGKTVNKSAVSTSNFAFYLGTGHIYHLSERFLVRLDFTSAVYNAQVFGTGGGSTWYSNLDFGAGVGIKL